MNFLNTEKYSVLKVWLTIWVFISALPACGKKDNQKIAHNHFKMAFLDVAGDGDRVIAYKRALAHVDQALQYEQRPEYYAFKATLLFKLGSAQESKMCYEQALALEPEHALKLEIINNYACLLAHIGDNDRAIEKLQDLINDPSYQTPEVALVNLGKLHSQAHHFIQAKNAFERAVRVAPSYVDAHYYTALIAHRLGDIDVAKQETQLVLDLEPEHVGATQLAAMVGTPGIFGVAQEG
jgi:Tfp pilus assembly protein PilF